MDYISIAIAVKLSNLYSNQDEFLSFPLGKIAFSNKSIDFMRSDSLTGVTELEKLNYKADFSRIVNIIPQDNIYFDMDASRFVWDEYIRCLEFSNFAKSSLTKEEEDELNVAINFLGRNNPSLDYLRYLQFKNVFDEADKTYSQAKLSVEFSTGQDSEILKKHWDSFLEKELREARGQAMNNWINLGKKNIIENYQAIRNTLELRKYDSAVKYLDDVRISEFVDTNGLGASIYSTLYSPTNIIGTDWNRMTITPSEIKSYYEKASEQIKSLFTANDSNNLENLESITLEYNYISVIRPWLHSSFFSMRNWKLSDDTIVSDGNVPRNGKLPALINGLVLIKNISYKYLNDEGEPNSGSTVLSILGERPLNDILKEIKTEIPKKEIPISGIKGPTDVGLFDPLPPIDHGEVTIRPIDIGDLLRIGNGGIIGPFRPEAAVEDVNVLENDVVINSESSTEYTVNEGCFVIAAICQRLPKAPNPDPNLTWT
ncbi:hypothetical protein BK124_18980 [Paenibacillus amylolyticus]|uniref:hypothetical protein n=1 Tax=Paenibacillus amylolyticus TaxID=1451 RepID=UPI00096C71AE|nr:hypothetical protein [Paenibacillus amylolyticus]OME95789.1 hypothetical protein BK124_18980 [Paenibacillus amylolyticus]